MNFNGANEKKTDTFAEINLEILKKNFEVVKRFANRNNASGEIKVCSIVKADGYGHGMNESGKTLAESGTDYLGTADYTESVMLNDFLKKFSKKNVPVLCLGILTEEKFFEDLISRNIDVTIADLKIAYKLDEFAKSLNKKINIQIQVDSGINRVGFSMKDAYESTRKLSELKNLKVKGIYSHFATSEIPEHAYAKKQIREFKILLKNLEQNVMKFELKHICNSGGILNYNDDYFNMVRPGISLYGYYPDRRLVKKQIGIKPVMTVKTKIKFIKELDKSRSISYGRKYFTKEKTKIASLPIGYGDGFSRLLTNKAHVYIKGKLYPTVGAICMDWTMADIGINSRLKINDEVIIFGTEYPADNLSERLGTIPYEITCGITPRVKRFYINEQ